MSKFCVLVVDDEEKMRKLLRDFLLSADFDVLTAADGSEALDLFCGRNSEIDAIVLDIMMPGLDGLRFLEEIRKISEVPVILLTAKSQEADQLLGFRLGADDYICKPFSPSLLVARVRRLLKRVSSDEQTLQEGCIRLDPASHSAWLGSEALELTPKEYAMLLYFIKNKGKALSRETLLNAVWSYDYCGDFRTVDTHVKQLRAKLLGCSDYIQTLRGVGYKFEAL